MKKGSATAVIVYPVSMPSRSRRSFKLTFIIPFTKNVIKDFASQHNVAHFVSIKLLINHFSIILKQQRQLNKKIVHTGLEI